MAIDALTMRQTMGRFATGVAVITTEHEGRADGMTINSLTSVSLEPPLLLVCFNHGTRTAETVAASRRFVVNILSARQQPLAMRFASRGEDHFAGLELTYEDHQVPVVPGSLAHLECEVDRILDAGDHTVVIGQVVRACTSPGQPLGFFAGRFGDVISHDAEPEHWFF